MSWSIIITVSNREKRLAQALNESGYPAFLPLKRTWQIRRGRHSERGRPVFPGYVFAVIEPQHIHAFHTDGASRILPVTPALQKEVDCSVLAWQIADRYGEYDDFQPSVKVRGKVKPRARNRRTRKIKRLMGAIAELTQVNQPIAA